MIEIYHYGCGTCGVMGVKIKRAKYYAQQNKIELEAYNTSYKPTRQQKQVEYLKELGLNPEKLVPVIVIDDKPEELLKWKP